MADRATLRPEDSRQRQRRDTWELCRGGYPFQVIAFRACDTVWRMKTGFLHEVRSHRHRDSGAGIDAG